MKKINNFLFVAGLMLTMAGVFPTAVKAILTYGNGYYTNLCDSGTAATYYNCDPGCNPATGSCQSTNTGVVKWICTGKWNQCLESESQWANQDNVDTVGCGYTVQISLFDKKCRRIDGSWDSSCKLLGYMTWYSGDCREGIAVTPIPTRTPALTPTPTVRPSATPVPTATPRPTATPKVSPTPTVTPASQPTAVGMCGVKCKLASDCKIGFACVQGVCRNPVCSSDKSCFCKENSVATVAAISTKTPETGLETWLGMAGMAGLGAAGFKLRRLSKKVW